MLSVVSLLLRGEDLQKGPLVFSLDWTSCSSLCHATGIRSADLWKYFFRGLWKSACESILPDFEKRSR